MSVDRQQQLMAEFVASRHSLFAFIHGFVRNAHDSEDLFQEVWVRLSRALTEGAEIQDQAKWCRGVARNLILHYWRDRKSDKVIADSELMDLVEQAFEEEQHRPDYWRARREAVAECMEVLPERARQLLRLKYTEGLSAEAAGAKIRQTAAAVLMALSRVRRALRECAEAKLKLREAQP
jgi:RNA polymerase sigma-70 factor (ECF subfamily)